MASKIEKTTGRPLDDIPATKERGTSHPIVVRRSDFLRLQDILEEVQIDALNLLTAEARAKAEKDGKSGKHFEEAVSNWIANLQERTTIHWNVKLEDKTKLGPMSLEEVLRLPNTSQSKIAS